MRWPKRARPPACPRPKKPSLRAQLDHTSIKEPDGTIHKVTRRTDLTGERS